MVREMITLPLRLGVNATRLGVHVATRATGLAVGISRRLIAGSVPAGSGAAVADAWESSSTFGFGVVVAAPPPPEAAPAAAPAPVTVAPEAIPRAAPPSRTQIAPAPDDRPAPEIPPAHVSEGLQFVEAFAEPGAEEGAGAAVHVKEPWRGYARLTKNEVLARVGRCRA